ncbi:MAG TPA: hypothetical protein VJ123_01470 [Anaerolineales bacterium]|nr:hypothetical protein [Anaerolineales bacterium]
MPIVDHLLLYFDSNVYDRISKTGAAEDVRKWIQRRSASLRVSEVILTEAFRIGDAELRSHQVDTIVSLATLYPRPGAFLNARELVSAIERYRPGWLRKHPDNLTVSRFLNLDRNVWRRLKEDPAYYPPGIEAGIEPLPALAGEVKRVQKRTRTRLLDQGEHPAQALTQAGIETHWRWTQMLQWADLLDPAKTDQKFAQLIRAYLRPEPVSQEEWEMFWLKDVTAADLPRSRAYAVADYFQRRYRVTAGNWMDAGHAVELLDVDYLVTGDQDFFKVLVDLRGELPYGGLPILLEPNQSVVDELDRRVPPSPSAPGGNFGPL